MKASAGLGKWKYGTKLGEAGVGHRAHYVVRRAFSTNVYCDIRSALWFGNRPMRNTRQGDLLSGTSAITLNIRRLIADEAREQQ